MPSSGYFSLSSLRTNFSVATQARMMRTKILCSPPDGVFPEIPSPSTPSNLSHSGVLMTALLSLMPSLLPSLLLRLSDSAGTEKLYADVPDTVILDSEDEDSEGTDVEVGRDDHADYSNEMTKHLYNRIDVARHPTPRTRCGSLACCPACKRVACGGFCCF